MKKLFFVFVCFLFAEALSADNMLVMVTDEPAGSAECQNGGKKIEVGTDTDGDNKIDVVDETKFVCNGADGANGESAGVSIKADDGTYCPGLGGIVVADGINELPVCNGKSGTDALIKATKVAAGTSGCPCPNGGVKIEVGLDNNPKNGMLDEAEISNTEYSCNGADGASGGNALSKITRLTDESAGDTGCQNGGVKIEVGVDADGDGELAGKEIDDTQTKYVCDGEKGHQGGNGPKGDDALSRTSEEPAGGNCANGGVKVEVGNDKNGDHLLNDNEVAAEQTKYVCNGAQGEKGDEGAKGDQGIQGETGASGANGKDGAAALVSVADEPKGENCVSGGKKIMIGVDLNRNGILDADEITGEDSYVCNGSSAEETGLGSSSTGCSLEVIDENGSLISAVLALFAAVFAIFALKKVRS